MRIWYGLPVLLLLLGCSRENAYRYFTKLNTTQERAVGSLQRITLEKGDTTLTLISAIYLNEADPELYRDNHYFLMALYDRNSTSIAALNITLNHQPPMGTVLLDENCSLRALMPLNNRWHKYYELVFPGSDEANLTLRVENGPSLQGEAVFGTAQ